MQPRPLFSGKLPAVTVILVSTCYCGLGRVPLFGFHQDVEAEAIFNADHRRIRGDALAASTIYTTQTGRKVMFVPVGAIDEGLANRLTMAGRQIVANVTNQNLADVAIAIDPSDLWQVSNDEVSWALALLGGLSFGRITNLLTTGRVSSSVGVFTDPTWVCRELKELAAAKDAIDGVFNSGHPTSRGPTLVRVRFVGFSPGFDVEDIFRDQTDGSESLLELLRRFGAGGSRRRTDNPSS